MNSIFTKFRAATFLISLFGLIASFTPSLEALYDASKALLWKATPCVITRSSVRIHYFIGCGFDQGREMADVQFSFTSSGVEYKSEQVYLWMTPAHRRYAMKYTAGQRAMCWVDPRNPGRAVLVRFPSAMEFQNRWIEHYEREPIYASLWLLSSVGIVYSIRRKSARRGDLPPIVDTRGNDLITNPHEDDSMTHREI
jgi:hypothetical protein